MSLSEQKQVALLNETTLRVSPQAYADILRAISAAATAPPPKAAARLRRVAPWESDLMMQPYPPSGRSDGKDG